MNLYFWSDMKRTFYLDTTRGECWISVTHLNQQCPNLWWYVCFIYIIYEYIMMYMLTYVSDPYRVRQSCTSEDST